MDKARILDEFCRATGHELAPDYRELWLALPLSAFMAKLSEWSEWSMCQGTIEF